MALQKQRFSIDITNGIDTKADEKKVINAKLLDLQNATFDKTGALTKRNGYQELTTTDTDGNTISSGVKLMRFKDQLLMADGDYLYSYNENEAKWRNVGDLIPCSVGIDRFAPDLGDTQVGGVVVSDGTYEYRAWWSGTIYSQYKDIAFSVKEIETGSYVIHKQLIETSDQSLEWPALSLTKLTNGEIVLVYSYDDGLNTYLKSFQISGSDLTVQSTDIITTFSSVTTTPSHHDAIEAASNVLFVTYKNPSTGYVDAKSQTRSAGSIVTNWTYTNPGTYTYKDGDLHVGSTMTAFYHDTDDEYYCFYFETGAQSLVMFVASNTGATVLTDTAVDTATTSGGLAIHKYYPIAPKIESGLGKVRLLYNCTIDNSASGYADTIKTRRLSVDNTGVYTVASTLDEGFAIMSKWYRSGTRDYILMAKLFRGAPVQNGVGQTTWFIGWTEPDAYSNPKPLCKWNDEIGMDIYDPRTGTGTEKMYLRTNQGLYTSTINGNTVIKFQCPTKKSTFNSSTSTSSESLEDMNVIDVTFNNPDGLGFVEMGGTLYIANGLPMVYDGVKVVEHGYLFRPQLIHLQNQTGGNLDTSAAYQYKVVCEWLDSTGRIHRSLPSESRGITTGASNNAIRVFMMYSSFTFKTGDVKDFWLVLYRTEGGGSTYYRVSDPVFMAENDGDGNGVVYFNDEVADSDITDQAIIYTAGGVLESDSAPACKHIARFDSRVFVSGVVEANDIYYSKRVTGDLAPAFNPFFKIDLLESNQRSDGYITGLSGLDDKLLIFKDNSILAISGRGPTDAGVNNQFSKPIVVTTDVGCTDPNSIVTTPLGVMFKSSKGIYIISRGLSVEYVGAPVEAYNSETISSAYVRENKNQVIFTLSSTTKSLVFDYYYNQWTTFTNYGGISGAFYDSKLCTLQSGGIVRKEDATYVDKNASSGNADVVMTMETSWLKLTGIQDLSRVYRLMILGDYKSDHDLTVGVAYNYALYDTDTYTLEPDTSASYNVTTKPTDANLEAGNNDGVYQHRVHLQKQKCQAIKLTISDSPQDSGESLVLTDIALEVGVKQGTFKTTANKMG